MMARKTTGAIGGYVFSQFSRESLERGITTVYFNTGPYRVSGTFCVVLANRLRARDGLLEFPV